MTRLEEAILRFRAQVLLLDRAAEEARAAVPHGGLALELGLGNGRTFHHLRARLPGWRIVAFDYAVHAHPSSVPAAADLILGDIEATAPDFARANGAAAQLLHADLGNGTAERDAKLERWMPPTLATLCAPGATVISSTRLAHAALLPQALPDGSPAYNYFLYRRA